jgi:hypothetical protein
MRVDTKRHGVEHCRMHCICILYDYHDSIYMEPQHIFGVSSDFGIISVNDNVFISKIFPLTNITLIICLCLSINSFSAASAPGSICRLCLPSLRLTAVSFIRAGGLIYGP